VYGVTMQEPGVSSFVSVRMRGEPVDDTIDVEATAKPSDPRRRPPAVPESEARA
jgi:hypothetical protein